MDKNKIGSEIDTLADLWTEEAAPQLINPTHSLLSPAAQKKRLNDEISQSLNVHFESIDNGVNHLLDRLEQQIAAKDPAVDPVIYSELLTKLSDQKIEDFTKDELKTFYVAAIDMYNHQEYNQAADAFYVLTLFEPKLAWFWKCLGNSKYMGGHFKDSIEAYETALKINPEDPECLLYLARCLENDKRVPESIHTLQLAEKIIEHNSQLESWKEKISDFLQDLKNK